MKPYTRVTSNAAEVRDSWTEVERQERRILAQAKQRWLWHVLEMSAACQKQPQAKTLLTKAG